jgi:hypothetical protein
MILKTNYCQTNWFHHLERTGESRIAVTFDQHALIHQKTKEKGRDSVGDEKKKIYEKKLLSPY